MLVLVANVLSEKPAQSQLIPELSEQGELFLLAQLDCSFSGNPIEQELLQLTNIERQKNGLPPLQLSQKLSFAAICHAIDMAENNFDSHTGSNGYSVEDRIRSANYSASYSGENIYWQSPNNIPANAINWWMSSQIHRDNILNPNYTEVGFGYSFTNNGNAESLNRESPVGENPAPYSRIVGVGSMSN